MRQAANRATEYKLTGIVEIFSHENKELLWYLGAGINFLVCGEIINSVSYHIYAYLSNKILLP